MLKTKKFYVLLSVLLTTFLSIGLFCFSTVSLAQVIPLDIDEKSSLEFFLDDSGGIVIIESTEDHIIIKRTKKNFDKRQYDCGYDFCSKVGKNIYFISNNKEENQAKIWKYSILKNEFFAPVTYNLNIEFKNDLAVLNGGKFFYLSSFGRKNIFSFAFGKSNLKGLAMKTIIKNIKNSPNGKLIYLQTNDDEKKIKIYDKNFCNNELATLSISPEGDFKFLNDDVIIDSSGNVFSRDTNSEYDFAKIFRLEEDLDGLECIYKNYIVKRCDKKYIKIFDLLNEERIIEHTCDGDIIFLKMYNEKMLIVEKIDGTYYLKKVKIDDIINPKEQLIVPKVEESKTKNNSFDKDLKFGNNQSMDESKLEKEESVVPKKEESKMKNNSFDNDLNFGNNQSMDESKFKSVISVDSDRYRSQDDFSYNNITKSFNTKDYRSDTKEISDDLQKELSTDISHNVEKAICSQKYNVDLKNFIIRNIEVNTSVSDFKKNMFIKDTGIKVIKKGRIVNKGKVGTGARLEFTNFERYPEIFTLVIKGDVTGSGSVNSLDLKEVYKHIFNTKKLKQYQLEAADINNDGKVDTLDLLSISKMIK